MRWTSPCTHCGATDFSEIGEVFLNASPEEMTLPDTVVDIWLQNDDKWINPQDEYAAVMYLDVDTLFSWLDHPKTTAHKKEILVEALCERLDFELYSEDDDAEDVVSMLIEGLKARKEQVWAARTAIDGTVVRETFPKLGISLDKLD